MMPNLSNVTEPVQPFGPGEEDLLIFDGPWPRLRKGEREIPLSNIGGIPFLVHFIPLPLAKCAGVIQAE